MKRKSLFVVALLALLLGINMQVSALSPSEYMVVGHDVKVEEPPLDEWMPDKNLQQALLKALNLRDVTELTQNVLKQNGVNLILTGEGIENIQGLEYAENVTAILLAQNSISDLTPLSELPKLRILELYANEISDLSPLANLKTLGSLNLWANQISDITPLSNLTDLYNLSINNNNIKDLRPLSGMKQLESLYLQNNEISDLSPISGLVKLDYLGIASNQVSNINALSELDNLKTLQMEYNNVNDLSPLSGLQKLNRVNANNQTINNKEIIGYVDSKIEQKNNVVNVDSSKVTLKPSNSEGVYDESARAINWIYQTTGEKTARSTFNVNLQGTGSIFSGEISQPIMVNKAETPLDEWMPDKKLQAAVMRRLFISDPAKLTKQKLSEYDNTLVLKGEGIANLKGLEYATSTRYILYIDNNEISDLSPLSNLTKLTSLALANSNRISDLRPLANLTNLEFALLEDNNIKDLRPLSGLKKLEGVRLKNNQISDLSPLSGLTNLGYIVVEGNKISDLNPISGLANLESINANSNQISDLNPISGLKKLKRLKFDNNKISTLKPISGLANLEDITANGNQITDLKPISGLEKLESLQFDNNSISNLSSLSDLMKLKDLSVKDQTILNKEIMGYIGTKIAQHNNIVNINKSQLGLKPSTSEGLYDESNKVIQWTYESVGKKQAISTFDTFVQAYGRFSGQVIQPILVVKEDLTSIEVKNSTIHINDKWTPEDNFVKAVDQDGNNVDISKLSVEGRVDTSKAGIYKVTYTILNHAGEKVSKTATITVQEKNSGNGDSSNGKDKNDKLPTTGYDMSIVGSLLGLAGVLGLGSLYLKRRERKE